MANHHELSDPQINRIFGCICVARYILKFKDDERFNLDVYKKTIELLALKAKPHLTLKAEPPYDVVEKIWLAFVRTGLILNNHSNQSIHNELEDSQLSEDSSEQDNEEFLPRRKGNTIRENLCGYKLYAVILSSILIIFGSSYLNRIFAQKDTSSKPSIKVDFKKINEISDNYANLLDTKAMNIIRARATVMESEISILLLVGRERDKLCKKDLTYCIGKAIANVTELPFGYIDASEPSLDSRKIVDGLSRSLIEGQSHSIFFDNLEQLRSCDMMSLFQFIDKDETNKRRGMIIFSIYLGDDAGGQKTRISDLAERILLKRWSSCVPYDTLTSVISRISGSIIKTY